MFKAGIINNDKDMEEEIKEEVLEGRMSDSSDEDEDDSWWWNSFSSSRSQSRSRPHSRSLSSSLSGLVDVQPDRVLQTPLKKQILWSIKTVGDRRKRQAQACLTYISDLDDWWCKHINLQLLGTSDSSQTPSKVEL